MTKPVTKRINNVSKNQSSIAIHVLPWIKFATWTKMVVFQLVLVATVLMDGVVMKQLRLALIHA